MSREREGERKDEETRREGQRRQASTKKQGFIYLWRLEEPNKQKKNRQQRISPVLYSLCSFPFGVFFLFIWLLKTPPSSGQF